jgi:DNA-binding CsgD family transcriptional regulator
MMSRPTRREIEVLRWVATGLTSHAIGRKMYLTENTIKTHLKRIYQLLGVSSRSQALAVAYEHDWWGQAPPDRLRLM